MKISKLALIALLGGALMAFGCSDDNGGGDGGSGGSGATGGDGGAGGAGGVVMCVPASLACGESEIEAIVPCCQLEAPPADDDACTGDESLVNPETCTATGTVVTHRVTMLKVAGGCDLGTDIDSCNGNSCVPGGLAPGEGAMGVDNAVYGLNATLTAIDAGNVGGVDQAFSDSFCGLTDGDEDETMCNDAVVIPTLVIQLAVDANLEENCANVTLTSGEATADVILNLGEATQAGTVCASGTIGAIPITVAGESGAIANTTIRATVNQAAGFSNGLLSGTVDGATAVTIATVLAGEIGAQTVGQTFDIRSDLTQDVSQPCDALSATFEIGGVVETGGNGI